MSGPKPLKSAMKKGTETVSNKSDEIKDLLARLDNKKIKINKTIKDIKEYQLELNTPVGDRDYFTVLFNEIMDIERRLGEMKESLESLSYRIDLVWNEYEIKKNNPLVGVHENDVGALIHEYTDLKKPNKPRDLVVQSKIL